jgi:hypothetical protein
MHRGLVSAHAQFRNPDQSTQSPMKRKRRVNAGTPRGRQEESTDSRQSAGFQPSAHDASHESFEYLGTENHPTPASSRQRKRTKNAGGPPSDHHDIPLGEGSSRPHQMVESRVHPSGSRHTTINEDLEQLRLADQSTIPSSAEPPPMPTINATNVVVVNSAGKPKGIPQIRANLTNFRIDVGSGIVGIQADHPIGKILYLRDVIL